MERKGWTLILVCVATFMLLLDITIVNVALPSIQRSLHASFDDLQWVVDACSLTLAALLLTAGSLADLFGRKRVFILGLAVFTFASLLCGLAGRPLVLNLSRGLQGIGGAMMFATSLALLAQEFHGRERGTAFGIWGATIAAAAAVGPLVGGALTEGLGWEYVFFLNLPIGAAAIVFSLTHLRETKDPDAARVDWAGLVTFSSGLFLLVLALIRGNAAGWGSTQIVVEVAAGFALLVLFVVAEMRQKRPMLDLSLFRKPTFGGASIAAFTVSASMFAMFLYVTLYYQNILHLSPVQTGLRFLPLTVVSFFAAPLAGRLSGKVAPRILMSAGLGLVAVALLLMHGVKVDSSWTTLLAGFVLAGIGVGTLNPIMAQTAIGVVPPARSGMASGINNTFRQVGVATGIAGLGAIFQHQVQSKATELLAGTPAGQYAATHGNVVQQLSSGGAGTASAPPGVRQQLVAAGSQAFVSGFNDILIVGAIVAAIGAVLTFVLVRRRDFVESAAPVAEAAA